MTEQQLKAASKKYRMHARILRSKRGTYSSLSLQTGPDCGSVSLAVEQIYGIQLQPVGQYFDDPNKAKEVYDEGTRKFTDEGTTIVYEGSPLYG